MKILFSALVPLLMFASCTRVTPPAVPVTPLYKTLQEFPAYTSAQKDSVLRADSLPLSIMFQYLGHAAPVDTALLGVWARSKAVEVFTPPVDSVFPDKESLSLTLGRILQSAAKHGLDFPTRSYAAVVWGNPKAIVMTDSCMLIALNHFLGEDYGGYCVLPQYVRKTKTAAALPYSIVEALIANRYPYRRTAESTVLSRMLYEGAMVVAKSRIIGSSSIAEAMGYTEAELKWLSDNRPRIWLRLVEGNLLYSTSELDEEKLVGPAPFTAPLGAEVPPRAGRFIGYTIVTAYLQQNATTPLSALLSPAFYNNPSILIESAYD